MSETPLPPTNRPAQLGSPWPSSRVPSRFVVLIVGVVGCCVHALLHTLAQAGWLALMRSLDAPRGLSPLLASGSVVVALAALCPGLAWWGMAWVTARRDARPLPAWELTVRVAQRLSHDRRARTDAFRATLKLHAVLGAPTLGVVLALEHGGLAWAALAVLALLWPGIWLAALRSVRRGYREPARTDQALAAKVPQAVGRIIAGLFMSTAALGLGASLLLAVPASTRRTGTCQADASRTSASIPGPIPGTRLVAEANAHALTLSATDGGGPGRIPLATCSVLSCAVVPTRVMVEQQGDARVVTLCPAPEHRGDRQAQQVVLAEMGYRLDDGVPRRVLRSDVSALFAGLLVLLGFGYARWGSRSLITWANQEVPDGASRRQARAALLWALALGSAQLTWLLVTWLGP